MVMFAGTNVLIYGANDISALISQGWQSTGLSYLFSQGQICQVIRVSIEKHWLVKKAEFLHLFQNWLVFEIE